MRKFRRPAWRSNETGDSAGELEAGRRMRELEPRPQWRAGGTRSRGGLSDVVVFALFALFIAVIGYCVAGFVRSLTLQSAFDRDPSCRMYATQSSGRCQTANVTVSQASISRASRRRNFSYQRYHVWIRYPDGRAVMTEVGSDLYPPNPGNNAETALLFDGQAVELSNGSYTGITASNPRWRNGNELNGAIGLLAVTLMVGTMGWRIATRS